MHVCNSRTCNDKLQVKGVLPGAVAGNAGVDASISTSDRLDDQWMNTIFPHQHLVGGVWADDLAIQLPDEVRRGEATDLWGAAPSSAYNNTQNTFSVPNVTMLTVDVLLFIY